MSRSLNKVASLKLALVLLCFKSPLSTASEKNISINPKGQFFVEKGVKKDICQDMATYLNKHVDLYLANPRYMMPKKFGPFRPPKNKKAVGELRYAIVATQSLIKGYERRNDRKEVAIHLFDNVDKIRKTLDEQFESHLVRVDINSDGRHENVLTTSIFVERYNFWNHVSFVLDDTLNLNATFKEGEAASGELFFYKNRAYSFTRYQTSVSVYHHSFVNERLTPSSAEKSIGLSQINICELPFVKVGTKEKTIKD